MLTVWFELFADCEPRLARPKIKVVKENIVRENIV